MRSKASYQHIMSSVAMSTAHCLMVNGHTNKTKKGNSGTSVMTVCGMSSTCNMNGDLK
jgi:hypothetical protein